MAAMTLPFFKTLISLHGDIGGCNNVAAEDIFYYNIAKNTVSRGSMFIYILLLTGFGVIGNLIADVVAPLLGL